MQIKSGPRTPKNSVLRSFWSMEVSAMDYFKTSTGKVSRSSLKKIKKNYKKYHDPRPVVFTDKLLEKVDKERMEKCKPAC